VKQVIATVTSNEQLWGEHKVREHPKYLGAWLIRLKCPEIASEAMPGQFVMIDCGEGCTLPRPFSVHQVEEGSTISIFYAVLPNGRGTAWLSQRKAAEYVGLFGALGNGFSIHPKANKLLLVAGGNGIAPIYFLYREALKKELPVKLLYGTLDDKRCSIFPQTNVVSFTEDGTVGYKGKVTDHLPEHVDWADQIFACGPLPMYKTMAQMPELKDKHVQISLETRMACGVGVCYGCTIRTKSGLKQVCADGPVFDLHEICWDELSGL